MNTIKQALLIVFQLFITGVSSLVYSQSPIAGSVTISSPNAASLGKYADIPVNYHTGIPQIGIPLYTIQTGPLSLPISLSYHASGLKVQEPASLVGAGWALNAGGVITRSVVGGPDEAGTGGVEEKGYFSNYGLSSYLFLDNSGNQDWKGFYEGRKDGQPDLFFFNFNGYSGKFYFNDDRTPMLVPEADLKISPIYNDINTTQTAISRNIQGFIITTPDGVRYYFGNTPDITGVAPIEVTNTVTARNGFSSSSSISSWYLNKIVSADDQFTITLTYEQESYGYHTIANIPLDPNNLVNGTDDYELVKNIIQGVRLSQINFSNGTGTVTFNKGNVRTDLSDNIQTLEDNDNQQATALGSIDIKSSDGFYKSFNFLCSYFVDNTPLTGHFTSISYHLHTDSKRLRLDQVQEVSGNGSIVIPPYKFSYFQEPVTRRLSFGVDHWGFMNGITGNSTLIPTLNITGTSGPTVIPGAMRDPAFPQMRGGSLEKISYPTGGSSTFIFEPNDVYTTTTSSTSLYSLAPLVVHLYGQTSQYTHTVPFTSTKTLLDINITNTYNYAAIFTIVSNNQVVYSTTTSNPQGNNTSVNFHTTISLPLGTYQATLSIPYYSNNINVPGADGGAIATVSEYRTFTNSSNVTVGGLRIQKMTHNDGISNISTVTSYNYKLGTQSSGILYSQPVYAGIVRNDLVRDIGYYKPEDNGFTPSLIPNGCTTYPDAKYYKSGGSLRPMATTQGYHIGYSDVQVTQSGNGSSLYQYYGSDRRQPNNPGIAIQSINVQCVDNGQSYPTAPLPFDYQRGELKYEAHYNEDVQMLKDVQYSYVFQDNKVTTPAAIFTIMDGHALATFYSITNARKIKTEVIQTDYTPGVGQVSVTTTSFYESPYHNQVTRKTGTNSTGDELVTKIKYVQDYRIAACDAIADGWTDYTNALNTCTQQFNQARSNCGNPASSACLTTAYLNRLICENDARINYVTYRKNNFTLPGNNFQFNHNTAKNSADAALKPILEMQDKFTNAPVETTQWKNNQLLKADYSIFDYSPSSSANVYLSKTQQVNLAAPSASFTVSNTSPDNTSLTKDTRYSDEASLSYNEGNVATAVKRDGIITSYLWGYNKQYPVAKAINATNAEIYYQGFEESSDVNAIAATSHTGSKMYNGSSYAVTWTPPNNRNYVISYWYRNTGVWKLHAEQPYVGNTFSLSGGDAYDDVRIHPSDAQMTTYTYSQIVGMTSQSDINNRTTYYEYDALGRLKLIRNNERFIAKKFQYNYTGNSCGPNCYQLRMQTLSSTNTIGYPVGVFNVNGKLVGHVNANNKDEYASIWNTDPDDQQSGILASSADPLIFNLSLAAGKTPPQNVTGCRYYQFDLEFNKIDGIRNSMGAYVDFGDLTGMRLVNSDNDRTQLLAPNTTIPDGGIVYLVHTYPNNNLKTITLYHNDDDKNSVLDNHDAPPTGLTTVKNMRGNLPLNTTRWGGSCLQYSTALSVANISNWSSINTITDFTLNPGNDYNDCKNLDIPQDFLKDQIHLQRIYTTKGTPYNSGYTDPSFTLSILKSDWTTYFKELNYLQVSINHLGNADLSGLKSLKTILVCATNLNNSNDQTNNPVIQISPAVIDRIINQVAAGAGQNVYNGYLGINSGGTQPTAASQASIDFLRSKGWEVSIHNWYY